jgi:outer membrane receptor protein involved in Fe transport
VASTTKPNVPEQEAAGIADLEKGTDGFVTFTWLHTSDAGANFIVSPYYHYNRQQYIGGPNDPLVTTDDTRSNYMGASVTYSSVVDKHTFRVGTDSFAEHDNLLFGLKETVGDGREATETQGIWSNLISIFAEDSYRAASWLTVNGGLRYERFHGSITEDALSPRIGAAMPLGIGVLRGSYSHYYQHPPTATISGPVLDFALDEGFGILPLKGERDKVIEVGYGIPVKGWTIDFDAYRNLIENFGDHDVLGNSNLLLPLTIAGGRVRSFESTLRSPLLFKRLEMHYAFAYQIAEVRGAVTGGMTDFQPPANNDYIYIDHDQRVTFNSGATLTLPRGFWVSETTLFGSGFLLGDGPDHLPSHTSLDIAAGKKFVDRLQVRFTATNITNNTYLTGFENSLAGTHYGYPRQVSVQVQYRFHY